MESSQYQHATSISEQWKNLQSNISMIETSMANRLKELESKEREIAEKAKSVENSRKEVELREKLLNEKTKEAEIRERETSEKFKGFEVKLQQFEFFCKGLKLKCRKSVEDMEVKVKKLDELGKELDCIERKIDEKSQILESETKEIDERWKELELKENEVLIMEVKAKERIDEIKAMEVKEIKVKECKFSQRCQALEARETQMNERCKAIDYIEQQLNKKCQDLELKTKELDDRRKQQELNEEELNKILQSQKLKAKQQKGFPTRIQLKTIEPQPEASSMIQSLCKSMATKGMKSYLMEHCEDSYLYWLLGLKNKIPSVIQSLIMREEHLQAVLYVCAFKMEEAFPPIPILKAHLECIQKRVQELVKKGTVKLQTDAINMELSALDSVLNCISNFKLESSFSPAPLQLRIKELRDRQLNELKEKEIDRHDNVEDLRSWDIHVKVLESRAKKMNECFRVQGWRKKVHPPCRTLELTEKHLSNTGCMEMESEPYNNVGIEQLSDRQLSEMKEKEIHQHNNVESGDWDTHVKNHEFKSKKMNEFLQVRGWGENKSNEPCKTLELKEKQSNNTGCISSNKNAEEMGPWDVHARTLGFNAKQRNECFQMHRWKLNEVHGPRTSELKKKQLSDTGDDCRHKNAEKLGEWDVHIKKKQVKVPFQEKGWRKNETHEPCRALELKERQNKMSNSGELWDSGTTHLSFGIDSSSSKYGLQADESCRNMDTKSLELYINEREKELFSLHCKRWQLCELKEKEFGGHDNNVDEIGEWDFHVKSLEYKKKANEWVFWFWWAKQGEKGRRMGRACKSS